MSTLSAKLSHKAKAVERVLHPPANSHLHDHGARHGKTGCTDLCKLHANCLQSKDVRSDCLRPEGVTGLIK
ncbi:unnamed protein product [Boreogadus saida]